MVESSEQDYSNSFSDVYEWFKENVHVPNEYEYVIRDNEKGHFAVIDLVSKKSGNVHFRVIIKINNSNVTLPYKKQKDFRELDLFFNTAPKDNINDATAYQVCYIQIDQMLKPINGLLYTYVPYDEQYVRFDLNNEPQ